MISLQLKAYLQAVARLEDHEICDELRKPLTLDELYLSIELLDIIQMARSAAIRGFYTNPAVNPSTNFAEGVVSDRDPTSPVDQRCEDEERR